jgi:hypothetical protein
MGRIDNSRTIADIEFVVDSARPGAESTAWRVHGVDCTRDRHRFSGQSYEFRIDVLQLRHAGTSRSSWHVAVVTEWWRSGAAQQDIRNTKWLKVVQGNASNVTAWIRRYRAATTMTPSTSRATDA